MSLIHQEVRPSTFFTHMREHSERGFLHESCLKAQGGGIAVFVTIRIFIVFFNAKA